MALAYAALILSLCKPVSPRRFVLIEGWLSLARTATTAAR